MGLVGPSVSPVLTCHWHVIHVPDPGSPHSRSHPGNSHSRASAPCDSPRSASSIASTGRTRLRCLLRFPTFRLASSPTGRTRLQSQFKSLFEESMIQNKRDSDFSKSLSWRRRRDLSLLARRSSVSPVLTCHWHVIHVPDPGSPHSRSLRLLLAVPDVPPRFIAHRVHSAPVPVQIPLRRKHDAK